MYKKTGTGQHGVGLFVGFVHVGARETLPLHGPLRATTIPDMDGLQRFKFVCMPLVGIRRDV